jgi:uncharacterized membrane protein YgaE (UPF0421/DUF939 family)
MDKTQEIREALEADRLRIESMPRKELNAHAFLMVQEQYEYEKQIKSLRTELDAAKQENERLKRQREFAIRANHGIARKRRQLQQRLKLAEEAIQVAYNIAYENFETVNQMDLIRLTLGDTLSIIRGEANKEENA